MQSLAGELRSTVARRYHSSRMRYRFRIRRSVGVAPSKAGGRGSSRANEDPTSTISRRALDHPGTGVPLSSGLRIIGVMRGPSPVTGRGLVDDALYPSRAH